jgi:hypothetical protein
MPFHFFFIYKKAIRNQFFFNYVIFSFFWGLFSQIFFLKVLALKKGTLKVEWDTHLQTKEIKKEKHAIKCEKQGHMLCSNYHQYRSISFLGSWKRVERNRNTTNLSLFFSHISKKP